MTKVLVVEDDQFLSSLLVVALNNEHLETHASYDGFEALIEVKSWHPDLVLLDLLMPNKDGIAVLADIRADSEAPKTKVIVFSNLGEADTIARVKKFGVTDYFIKANTNPHEVVAKIKSIFPEAAAAVNEAKR